MSPVIPHKALFSAAVLANRSAILGCLTHEDITKLREAARSISPAKASFYQRFAQDCLDYCDVAAVGTCRHDPGPLSQVIDDYLRAKMAAKAKSKQKPIPTHSQGIKIG